MTDSPTSKQALRLWLELLRQNAEDWEPSDDHHYESLMALLADEPKANHPPCIYRNGCVRPDCTEHCMGFRREAEPPADAQFICPHGKDVRHIECGQCNAQPPTNAPLSTTRLLGELDEYLSRSPAEAIHAGSILHQQIKSELRRHALTKTVARCQDSDGCPYRDDRCKDRCYQKHHYQPPVEKPAAPPEKPVCACGHPYWMHETPGTECAEEDCRCTSYRCPDEKTATGMTSKDNLDMQEAVRTLSAHETEGSPK